MKKRLSAIACATLVFIGCGGGSDSNTKTVDGLKIISPTSYEVQEGTSNLFTINTDKNNVIFKIVGGADQDKFKIVADELQFISVPDFENPSDADKNNDYEVTIEAQYQGEKVNRTFRIKVVDDILDNGPTFISASSKSIPENQKLNFVVRAEDRSGKSVRYAIVGGSDRYRFDVDTVSGKLSFSGFIPDYENSSDANHDNKYEVAIKAIDENNNSSVMNVVIIVDDDPDDIVPPMIIYKTGQDDGLKPGLPFGDDRNFDESTVGGDHIVIIDSRKWQDSDHVNASMGYEDALNYCSNLNYAGLTGWRAPNRHELLQIINYDKQPKIDDVFQHRKNGKFWTSQERRSSTTDHSKSWTISFDDAEPYDEPKINNYHIRCVKGPEITDHHDFTKNDHSTIVTDNDTGLMWELDIKNQPLNWYEAKERCKNLVLEGYDDWRLPNINEMMTIIPIDGSEVLFQDLSPLKFDTGHAWSSTDANATNARYSLNFWDQESDKDSLIMMYAGQTKEDNDQTIFNRCIRGGHL